MKRRDSLGFGVYFVRSLGRFIQLRLPYLARNAVKRGDIVAGKYRLKRVLGKGAQGHVWEGVHEQMGTPLAIKMLDPNLAGRADYVSRFKREARAAAALRSPHVVQIFDFGIWQEVPYIAMELLDGEDLGERLDRVRRLAPATVSSIVAQVARALLRAHRHGIVHRDMKPDNIFLCRDDEGEGELVKILDFGVAKAVGGTSLARTGTGIVLGTPYYMSPEQAQGDSQIDHRTDLWALGVITYEAMVGRRPFEATNLGDLLVKICATDPPRPSSVYAGVPDGFDAWFSRACAHHPQDRFGTAKEMAVTLSILCGTVPQGLSDSSYVNVFPSNSVKVDVARPDEPSGMIAENDPTQVMTEFPDSVRRVMDQHAQENAKDSIVIKETNGESKKEAGLSSWSPIASASPVHVAAGILPQVDDEDDPVLLFNSADIAADMERLKRVQQQQSARTRRQQLWNQYHWHVVSGLVLLVGILVALIVVFHK